jgi:adenylate cyclase
MLRDSVEASLAAVLASRPFAQSLRMQRFLRFAVERELAGDRDSLKEYTVGTEVFDRPADFDPRIDSIVRVEARRLRKKLKQYYETEGKGDALRITLPDGSYVPVFAPAAEQAAAAAPSTEPGNTLAVLPLRAVPLTEENEFFADGLTEDLIDELSRLPGLRVVARSSVFQFKNSLPDIAEVSRKLGVGKVVEGTVRRHGDQVKVAVQLIDAADSSADWSEVYSREMQSIFDLQQEIARSVGKALGRQFGDDSRGAAHARHVVPAEAYQQLLEGRHFAALMTPSNLLRSVEYFQRAVQIDPDCAPAYAAFAGSMLQMALFGNYAPSLVIPEASRAIYKALNLNPDLPGAHMWRGFMHASYEWNWDEAEVDFQQALDLNPNLTTARIYFAGLIMLPQGRFDEALAHLRAAERLDSASVILYTVLAMTQRLLGDLPAAEGSCRRANALNREYYGAYRTLAFTLHGLGRTAEAIAELESALPLAGDDMRIACLLAYFRAVSGERERALEIQQEVERAAAERYVASHDRAVVKLGLGNLDEASTLLQRSLAEHEPWLAMLRVEPVFDPLRDREDFRALVRRVFPQDEP